MDRLKELLDLVKDKPDYKTTTTSALKLQLYSYIVKNGYRNILELGCDTGNTTVFLAEAARVTKGMVFAVDVDSVRISKAKELLEKAGLADYVRFMELDLYDERTAPLVNCADGMEFVFIDVNHEHRYVKMDIERCYRNGASPDIVLHDYGLIGAGVKSAITECECVVRQYMGLEKNWNPKKNNTDDWEAALI